MCKQGFLTELTADLIARMVRRHFGWDKIPTIAEVDDFFAAVKEKIPEVEPCTAMDTELLDAIRGKTVTDGVHCGD